MTIREANELEKSPTGISGLHRVTSQGQKLGQSEAFGQEKKQPAGSHEPEQSDTRLILRWQNPRR